MSILNVELLNHGFGDRAILKDVTFRLLKGEHVGFVGANGCAESGFCITFCIRRYRNRYLELRRMDNQGTLKCPGCPFSFILYIN